MKQFACRGVPVLFSAWIALVLAVRFLAVVRGYEYPWNHSRAWWEFPWLLKTGAILVHPLALFVEQVLSRIDFRLACASFWHPVYQVGFLILWIGYSGTFLLAWILLVQEVRRRGMKWI